MMPADFVNTGTTWEMPSISELVNVVREHRDRARQIRNRMADSIAAIVCPKCGRRAIYLTDPWERAIVCKHVFDDLRQQCASPDSRVLPADTLSGLRIEVADA